uniref:Cytochrome P450 n=1 Tax=Streptomyces sp. ACT50-5 TaxID=507444 RepID=B1Q4K2_9ACTN|nr:cytochrome P450 [Streptomyces sp. ACT50-5]
MTQAAPVTFSTVRENYFGPPAEMQALRHKAPVTRTAFADGRPGWLVTGYSAARAVLSDSRFTARGEREHPAVPRAATLEDERCRRLIAGQFTARRMRQLTGRTERIVREHLDAMEHMGSPADLVEHFALPVPSLVIAELLGVPPADREQFQHDTLRWGGFGRSTEEVTEAFVSLGGQLQRLVRLKRTEPGDDLLSGLIAADPALTDEELASIAFLLLVAGHGTTAHQIALGAFLLLEHPDQLAALRADPALTESAVEELLRHLSVVHHGPTRAALQDADIEGTPVKAGEVVVVSLGAANRDPARFERPDAVDVTREDTGHLAFGHGMHQCLGRQLARIELRVALTALLERFPHLRLACPAAEIPLRHDMQVYGADRLPVAW